MARRAVNKSKQQVELESIYRHEVALESMPYKGNIHPGAGGLAEAEPATQESTHHKHRSVSNQPSPQLPLPNTEAPSFGQLGAPASPGDVAEVSIDFNAPDMTEMAPVVNEDLLLDAWYAEYGDPITRMALRRPDIAEAIMEVVIGEDDRVQITTQSVEYPWRCICSLRITAANGTSWIGTGWLCGPRTVVTAGHCVFIHSHGGWARQIEVIPGRNGAERPFDACVATTFRSVEGWTQDRDRNVDYGVILLPTTCRYGDQLGWYGFANFGDDTLRDLHVNLSGYPGDKPTGTQWFHAREIKQVTQHTVIYEIDTAGGQSGAPVWIMRDGNRYSVAIHTNGALSGNSATRITQEVFANLVNWRNEAA